MLAFPTGRLETRVDRLLVGILAVLVATLYLPTALLVEQYPVPVPWTSCGDACPHNALMVASTEPAAIEDLIRPLRELLTVVVLTAVTVRLALRLHAATRLRRRVLAPVLAVACLHYGVYAVALVLRRAGADGEALEVAAWGIALTFPLTAFAFLVGLARWWVFIAVSTRRLAGQLRAHPTPHDLRGALATAFDDPGLQVLYWIENGRGALGRRGRAPGGAARPRRRALPHRGARRRPARGRDRPRRRAARRPRVHRQRDVVRADRARQPAPRRRRPPRCWARCGARAPGSRRRRTRSGGGSSATSTTARSSGSSRCGSSSSWPPSAPARTTGTATARRRCGRSAPTSTRRSRRSARSRAGSTRRRWPTAAWSRDCARRRMSCALPATVLAAGVGRYPRAIESAAYFCCLEALQNAAKHAHGRDRGGGRPVRRRRAAVRGPRRRRRLRSRGRERGGVGFTSMRDRLAAVGGEVAIVSRPGHGTRVSARIPLAGGV